MEKMQKLNFPGTHWRGLALIGAQKKRQEHTRWYPILIQIMKISENLTWDVWINFG